MLKNFDWNIQQIYNNWQKEYVSNGQYIYRNYFKNANCSSPYALFLSILFRKYFEVFEVNEFDSLNILWYKYSMASSCSLCKFFMTLTPSSLSQLYFIYTINLKNKKLTFLILQSCKQQYSLFRCLYVWNRAF